MFENRTMVVREIYLLLLTHRVFCYPPCKYIIALLPSNWGCFYPWLGISLIDFQVEKHIIDTILLLGENPA
jgi:hypothetical protein